MFACVSLYFDPGPYHPHRPFGRAQTAPRPRWSRTCWPNTLGTGTFARLANQKPGNGGSAVWLPCWSAAMLQCPLSTVGEWGHEKVQPPATRPHQWARVLLRGWGSTQRHVTDGSESVTHKSGTSNCRRCNYHNSAELLTLFGQLLEPNETEFLSTRAQGFSVFWPFVHTQTLF